MGWVCGGLTYGKSYLKTSQIMHCRSERFSLWMLQPQNIVGWGVGCGGGGSAGSKTTDSWSLRKTQVGQESITLRLARTVTDVWHLPDEELCCCSQRGERECGGLSQSKVKDLWWVWQNVKTNNQKKVQVLYKSKSSIRTSHEGGRDFEGNQRKVEEKSTKATLEEQYLKHFAISSESKLSFHVTLLAL